MVDFNWKINKIHWPFMHAYSLQVRISSTDIVYRRVFFFKDDSRDF